jgi:hypothetical protein
MGVGKLILLQHEAHFNQYYFKQKAGCKFYFTIINSKLYLNYNLQVKAVWIKDTASRIKTADTYWPALNQ